MSTTPPEHPALRVVRGSPTDEELAALVVALSAVAGGGPPAPARAPHSSWTDRARLMTSTWSAGPGGWRASASRR